MSCCGSSNAPETVNKSNRPVDNAFQQQKLNAWQPLLTAKWVIGSFFLVGAVFIPIGIVVLMASQSVVEQTVRYDTLASGQQTLSVTIEKDMDKPVFFYYKLSNFYQNHRRYVKSRSDDQNRGQTSFDVSVCDPITNYDDKTLYPCGLIAQSFFNDTFTADLTTSSGTTTLSGDNWDGTNIAWSSDVDDKFKRRAPTDDETTVGANGYNVWTGSNNEEFIVWMRSAGLPTFKKLHRKINTNLKAGDVMTFNISNVYPVSSFDGEKSIVLSTVSSLGGKNDFLGIAYIAVGVFCVVFALCFLIKTLISPRKLGNMRYFRFGKKQE